MAELRERGVVSEEYDLPGIKTVNGIAEIQGVKGGWFKGPGRQYPGAGRADGVAG
jgi:hypothetical protein